MTQEEIKEILDNHRKWLTDKTTGKGADLRFANLEDADLRFANLEDADLSNADLRYADLRYADLRYADLRNVNLSNADLRFANLEDADLRFANLEDADLRYADLSNAELRFANLSNADLRFAKLENTIGNGMEIKTFQFSTYTVVICKNVIQIGCKRHSQAEWWGFTDDEIEVMDAGALEWWKEWKEVILKVAKGE